MTSRSFPAALVIGVCVFGAYLPVVVVPYAVTDDYPLLAASNGHPVGGASWTFFAQSGRPLHWMIERAAFWPISDIDGLRWIRLVSLIGITMLALLLLRAFIVAGMNPWVSVAASISIVSLPSFQVFASSAYAYAAAYCAILAGLASLTLGGALETSRGKAGFRFAGAVVLLLSAILIYQHVAMFFWVFAAIAILRPSTSLRGALRLLGLHLLVAVAALSAGYGVFKLATRYYGQISHGRGGLTHDPGGKVRWFFDEPLGNAFGLAALAPSRLLVATVGIGAGAGIVLLHRTKGIQALGYLMIAAILVPLSYLPNLAVVESWASYRSIGALAALAGVYAWLGLWGMSDTLQAHVSGPARTAARRIVVLGSAALAIASISLAARHVTTLFVVPQSKEVELLRAAIDQSHREPPRALSFIRPEWWQGAAPVVRYDEFGLPSSSQPWVPDPFVYLVLREHGWDREDVMVEDLPPTTTGTPTGDVIVDMRRLQTIREGWIFWTLSAR